MVVRVGRVRAWALVALALALGVTAKETRRGAPLLDFGHLSTSAECLLDGCDPYAAGALNREAAARGEGKPRVWAEAPVYPPSSLVMVLPFARMGWPGGAMVFDALSGVLFGVACGLMVWRMGAGFGPAALMLGVGVVCHPFSATLRFGNPALLFMGLAGIACLLMLDGAGGWRAWCLLGAALALKPQLGVGVVAALVWNPRTRRDGWKALAVAAGVLVVGCAAYRWRLGSFEFVARFGANLKASLAPGSTSDFSRANVESYDFLNVQAAYSRVGHVSRAAAEALAWVSTAALSAAAWWVERRTDALRRRPWTMVALLCLVGLLPVYHRGYDRVIALLLVPAAVEMERGSRWWAWGYAGAVCWWVANDTVMGHVLRRWHYVSQNGWEELVICVVLLGSLWWTGHLADGWSNRKDKATADSLRE